MEKRSTLKEIEKLRVNRFTQLFSYMDRENITKIIHTNEFFPN